MPARSTHKQKRFHCDECPGGFTRLDTYNQYSFCLHPNSNLLIRHRKKKHHNHSPIRKVRAPPPRKSCVRCFQKKVRCEPQDLKTSKACKACRNAGQDCSLQSGSSSSTESFGLIGATTQTRFSGMELNLNTPCNNDNPSSFQDATDSETQKEILDKYPAIYERFPIMHPYAVPLLYCSALNQSESEKDYLCGIIDALCSLICLVYEETDKCLEFYQLAKMRLGRIGRLFVERVIISTILVSFTSS